MCGIVGLIDFRERPDPSRVQRAVAALAHRGPDHQGLWSDGQACLGHARLSVIDLDPRSHQPMVDADTGLVLVYNGEIYNFRELRRDLETRGVRFRTEGDSEVLLSAYKVWGLDCLLRLRGMFAFAVWDPGSRTLVLARDRVGKKPLVFSRTSERLVFASEIRALIALGGVDRSLDFEALDLFLCQSYIPAPWTIYRGVRKLEPGCWALMRSGCWETGRYWDPDFRIKQNPDEAQVEDQARSELERAVQERMISDVPLGVMLSGGLDSALVAALMARYSDRPVKSFTVGFDDPRYDEGNEARATAEYLGLDHHELRVESGRELGEVLPRVLGQFGEPYGDDSALPSYILSGMVRSEVTVVLNGDGGDELCGGYAHYRRPRWMEQATVLVGGGRSMVPEDLERRMDSDSLLGRARRNWLYRYRHPEMKPLFRNEYFQGRIRDEILNVPASQSGPGACAEWRRKWVSTARSRADSIQDRLSFLDQKTYLPGDLLVKMDICSMAHGLETRSPLLDQDLMALFASLPGGLRVGAGRPKRFLKRLARSLLPISVLSRPKRGFSVPVSRWMREDLAPLMADVLAEAKPYLAQWLDLGAVDRMTLEHQTRKKEHGSRLWLLLCLGLWAVQEHADLNNQENP